MAKDSPDNPEGVFGNLPSSRPGSRSPRRRDTGADDAAQPEPVEAEPAPAREEQRAPDAGGPEPQRVAEPEPQPPEPPRDPLSPEPGIKGVEDLAWAGVAAVAQAATAGIRFTSKALEAARKSIDRP